jgi:hypothetical protein
MNVIPIGGLCNRLRVIGSYLSVARSLNKTLTVWWNTTVDCPARFSDLFCTPPTDLIMVEDKDRPRDVEKTCIVYPDSTEDTWSSIAIEVLRPLPAIQARIDAILARLGPEFSAVHIRRTDHNARYDEDAVYVAFAAAAANPCFCAADNPRSVVTLKRALGDRLVYGGSFRVTGIRMTGLADALVDLWVSSHATRFRGTYYSSFSDWIEMMRRSRDLPVGDISKIEGAK